MFAEIRKVIPSSITDYREPFCGGANVFLTLRHLNALPSVTDWWLSDYDAGVISFWKAVQEDAESVIDAYREIRKSLEDEPVPLAIDGPTRTTYRKFQSDLEAANSIAPPTLPDDVCAHAAKFLFVNNSCFRGLISNSFCPTSFLSEEKVKGGRQKGYWEESLFPRIRRAAELLRGVRIDRLGYDQVFNTPPSGISYMFLDPPYDDSAEMYQASEKQGRDGAHFSDIGLILYPLKEPDGTTVMAFDDIKRIADTGNKKVVRAKLKGKVICIHTESDDVEALASRLWHLGKRPGEMVYMTEIPYDIEAKYAWHWKLTNDLVNIGFDPEPASVPPVRKFSHYWTLTHSDTDMFRRRLNWLKFMDHEFLATGYATEVQEQGFLKKEVRTDLIVCNYNPALFAYLDEVSA